MPGVALQSHDAVRWLLDNEPDVRRSVEAFTRGEANVDHVDVAGPPTAADLVKYRRNESRSVGLPRVRLQMRMVRHHLTGAPGVRVLCTEAELEEIGRWRLAATMRRNLVGAV